MQDRVISILNSYPSVSIFHSPPHRSMFLQNDLRSYHVSQELCGAAKGRHTREWAHGEGFYPISRGGELRHVILEGTRGICG
jgi:hypothetical protein